MIISSALGYLLLIAASAILAPLAALPFFPSELYLSLHFLAPAAALALPGLVLVVMGRGKNAARQLSERDGAAVVTLGWLAAATAGAWPFMGIAGLRFSQAFFESMSGWTTTGLSMVDVENAPALLLLYRSTLQLFGGAGLAIIMMAAVALPVGAGLYRAEGRNYQLVPNVTRSAKIVVVLYTAYTAVGIVLLTVFGMSPFDAVNHAFCAVSTGGFSTKAASIGHWDSPLIEATVIILMVLGNLNFLSAYVLFTGKVRRFLKNSEFRLFMLFAVLGIAGLLATTTIGAYASAGKDLRIAVFEAVSALTTTGYSTTSYAAWEASGWGIILVLMFVGGGMCSTAGGVKQYRVHLLLKSVVWEIRRMLLPRRAIVTHHAFVGEDRQVVEDRLIQETGVFFFLYLAAFALGMLLLTFSGYGLPEAAFEFASALGTVGLSVGVVSVQTPEAALWTMAGGMLLGRLEFFVVILSVSRLFRR